MLEIGTVVRPHGLRGDVVVNLVSNRPERTDPGARFQTGGGLELLLVKATALGGQPEMGRFIMSFAGVDNRERAEELRGQVLMACPLPDSSALWVHQLVGSEVLDGAGAHLGRVVGVVANPASDLLELEGGQLVPVRFVVEVDEDGVVVDIPPGLFEAQS